MTLEHFATVFAFVVIITGVSLLVTPLTQTRCRACLATGRTHAAEWDKTT